MEARSSTRHCYAKRDGSDLDDTHINCYVSIVGLLVTFLGVSVFHSDIV